ncbi:MAG: hypothetical protein JSV91_14195 [Phycisphaerales bacterium]|nr:MAG: hypothetical protein JSV91_14195 [Phycisphaerales bacterium]
MSDDWVTDWGNDRWVYYDGYYIPRVQVDGLIGLVGSGEGSYANMEALMYDRLAEPTDVTIELFGEEVGDQTYRIIAMIGLEEGGTAKTVRVHLINTLWDYPDSTDGRYNNGVKEGIEIGDINLTPGETVTVDHAFTFDDESWTAQEDIRIAAYVHDPLPAAPAEVYQAEMMAWPFPVFSDCNGNGIPDDQEAYLTSKLQAADGAAEDNFGRCVAVGSDHAIAGARRDDDNGADSGSAYIYRRTDFQWIDMAKLTASDGAEGDEFGYAVAIDGVVAVVGAPDDDDQGDDSGSVYVFRHDGVDWIEEAKLTASDGAVGDDFGAALALRDNTLIIGAHLDDDNGEDSGSVYVYRYDGANWMEEAKLTASDGESDDDFGGNIAIGGGPGSEITVIGAYRDDDNGSDAGAAYVFRFDGTNWVEQAKLVASDGQPSDLFGAAVAVDDDVALIGASWDDETEANCGSAYIFRYDGANWNEDVKLLASDGAVMDFFGWAVAIDGDAALIGASYDDDHGTKSGSAYLFRYDGTEWFEVKITAADGAAQDMFGQSVAIKEDTIVIGASGDNAGSGAMYIYDGIIASDCNFNGAFDICDIADGVSDDLNENGIPDECECPGDVNNDLMVNIDDLFQVLGAWGTCDDCPEDINGDGLVDIDDIFAVLGAWGPCE